MPNRRRSNDLCCLVWGFCNWVTSCIRYFQMHFRAIYFWFRISCRRQFKMCFVGHYLTHWGRMTHLCISKVTSIASDNGLSPGRRQAIIWNNAGILLIGPLGTNVSEILIAIQTFSLKKIRLKMSSAKCRPFCLGLNVLTWPTRSRWNFES